MRSNGLCQRRRGQMRAVLEDRALAVIANEHQAHALALSRHFVQPLRQPRQVKLRHASRPRIGQHQLLATSIGRRRSRTGACFNVIEVMRPDRLIADAAHRRCRPRLRAATNSCSSNAFAARKLRQIAHADRRDRASAARRCHCSRYPAWRRRDKRWPATAIASFAASMPPSRDNAGVARQQFARRRPHLVEDLAASTRRTVRRR